MMNNIHKQEITASTRLHLENLTVPTLPSVPSYRDDGGFEDNVPDTPIRAASCKTSPSGKGQRLIGRRRISDPKSRKPSSANKDPTISSFKICIYENITGNRAQLWPMGIEGHLAIAIVDNKIQCTITSIQNTAKKWTYNGCSICHVFDSSLYYVFEDKSTKLGTIGIGFPSRVVSGNFRMQLGKLLTTQKGHPVNFSSDLCTPRRISSPIDTHRPDPNSTDSLPKLSHHKSEPEITSFSKVTSRFAIISPRSPTNRVQSSPRLTAYQSTDLEESGISLVGSMSRPALSDSNLPQISSSGLES